MRRRRRASFPPRESSECWLFSVSGRCSLPVAGRTEGTSRVRPSTSGAICVIAEKGTAVKDCAICGKMTVPGSTYCARCRKFVSGKYERQARLKALKQAWNKKRNGFSCEYTGIRFEEYNTTAPWHPSSDHRVPGKKGDLAVSARSVNTVKATLTARQFPRVMEALSGRLGGNPFDERVLQH